MGSVNTLYSRRTNYAECYYWIRDEYNNYDMNKWVLENVYSGSFYAKEISPASNQMAQQGGVFANDLSRITLETNDEVADIKRGCIVVYNGKPWMVDNVQLETHRKQSFMSVDTEYKYYISLRR